jgi:16S rRNA (cytosine967-C5)-methyltransferase
MISPARALSYQLLSQIGAGLLFSDDALNSGEMEQLEVRDRHLTTEIVYGSLRWQGLLDHMLANVSSRPWHQVEAGARILLRMSVYQMWQLNRIPDHALVNDAVELAKSEFGKGIDRYINGILRHLSRTRPWTMKTFLQDAPAWVRGSLPQWLWARWSTRFGEETAAEYALSLNKLPQPAFRLGDKALESLSFRAVCSDLVPGAGIRLEGTSRQDLNFQYQDEASQLIPYLLDGISGARVWDACAAPGGKSSILVQLSGESGHVVASDLRKDRIARMAELLSRLNNIKLDLVLADASKPPPFRCSFDAVVTDVPCSGLGTLRRNPEIKWLLKPETLNTLHKTQCRILDSASIAVRAGGQLLYSTCSTEPEENEDVINSFLSSHRDFNLRRPTAPSGIERWIGKDQMVRTFPSTRLWDGFFAALLVRR